MHEPLDNSIKHIIDIPYTISFVIRKRIQIDNFNELPKDKRPPSDMIWDGTQEDVDDWLDKVFKSDSKKDGINVILKDDEVEG